MWRKQQNKSHHFWSTFGHSKVVWKTANGTEFLCQCLNIPSLNSVLVTTLWSLVSLQPIQTSPSSFKQSCRARCVEQTLFKDPILNHPLSLSNRGSKIESVAVFRLWNISNHLINMPCSHVFVKQLKLSQIKKLDYMFWGRACKKMEPVWLCFGHQFVFLLIAVNVLALSCWALITH